MIPPTPIRTGAALSGASRHGGQGMNDKVALVRGFIWASELTNGELERAAQGISERTYARGAYVCHRGDQLSHWGGIVDTCPDASPIISKTDIEGLYFDCGWGTGGFKATPGSGHVFADLIANDRPNKIAAPYTLDRFRSGLLIDEHGAAGVAH